VRIGILHTGHPPRALQPQFGDYPKMFEDLLAGHGYDWRAYDVPHGDWPAAPEDQDAYLVTGSPAGVYDPDPWIAELLAFLRSARGRAKLVGICFGHQALAQAFGGQVSKSPKGWGIGLHTYRPVGEAPGWMDAGGGFSLSASHQDQVVQLPPAARVIAGSDFCPNGMLTYDDAPAISLQLHPEFVPAYSAALIEGRRGALFPEAEADAAIESLKRPDDHVRAAGWIARFLEG